MHSWYDNQLDCNKTIPVGLGKYPGVCSGSACRFASIGWIIGLWNVTLDAYSTHCEHDCSSL